jgi:hypothetical protein
MRGVQGKRKPRPCERENIAAHSLNALNIGPIPARQTSTVTTIRSFNNQVEASLCASFLQAHGFDAVLLDEASFQWVASSMAVPIRLQVPEEKAAEAIALLDSSQEPQAGDTPSP